MSLIKHILSDGDFDIEQMLLSEGFQKNKDDLYQIKVIGGKVDITVVVEVQKHYNCSTDKKQKTIQIFIRNKIDKEVISTKQIFYQKETFFERYSLLLECLKKSLNVDLLFENNSF